jgi:hypothetical protein
MAVESSARIPAGGRKATNKRSIPAFYPRLARRRKASVAPVYDGQQQNDIKPQVVFRLNSVSERTILRSSGHFGSGKGVFDGQLV